MERSAAVCPVCKSAGAAFYRDGLSAAELSPSDLMVTDARYGTTLALHRCRTCGFIFADPRDIAGLVALYERLDDPTYIETQDSRLLQMQWLLDLAREKNPAAATLLDVGAGAGALVREARSRGFSAEGVEPCKSFVEAAVKNGVRLFQGSLPHADLAGRKFDVVFLVDVIEHVADPVSLLAECGKLLAENGLLLAVTPDADSLAARLFGRRWWHRRVAHVGYFNRDSFERAAAGAKLSVRSFCRARWFFRIDYLAERLTRYLPLGWFNRWARRNAFLKKIYDKIIPLNLFDSYVFFLGNSNDRP